MFTATVAITLYTVFDKTLLGILATKESVAYYEYSYRIVSIPIIFASIISTVLYPKACRFAEKQDYESMNNNLEKAVVVANFISFASCFGLWAIADLFALLYYGKEFAICGSIISSMCPLILISCIGEVIRSQYIYPLKMDLSMVKILSINAIVNLLLSAALIPSLGVGGAVVGSIGAEFCGLAFEVLIVRKYVSIKWLILQCVPHILAGTVMYIIIKIIAMITKADWMSLVIQVLIGALVYSIGILIYMCLFKRQLLSMICNEITNRMIKNK